MDQPKGPLEVDSISKKLESAVTDKMANLTALADLKTAAEISASLAAARKTHSEAQNYARQLRLEGVKSLSTFLVPLVSLLTLFATILIQSYQLRETRQENEDKQWRELLDTVKASVKDGAPDVTIAPRLRSFFNSARYEMQAKEISKRVIGQLTYEPGFRDLFETIFGSPKLLEIADTTDIARTLRLTQNSLEARCLSASADFTSREDLAAVKNFGLCSNVIPETEFSKLVASQKVSDQIIQMRRSYFEILGEQVFIRDRIVGVIRDNYLKGKVTDQKVNLSGIFFNGGDLSGVDFSNFDMSDTVLNYVSIDDAVITPFKGAKSMQMWGTAWWKAEKMDQELLKSAVTYMFPFYVASQTAYPAGDAPEKAAYVGRIKALCVPMQDFCEEKNLRFGNAN